MNIKNKKAIETQTLLTYLLWIVLAIIIIFSLKTLFERIGII